MKLTNSLNVKQLIETEWFDQFDSMQQKHIEEGLLQGLQVELYADPRFTATQMHAIMCGLAHSVDVSKYAFIKYNHVIMGVIYHLLKNGACFGKYVIEDHLDVDKIMRDYELLIRYKGFSRLDKWAIDMIYDGAPYYVKQ